jgi:hypothetical protein
LDELEDIFSTFMGAFCLPLLDEMFVCLFDDSDDEKSDARFNSLSLSLSLSLFLSSRLFSSRFSGCGSLFVF